MKNTTSEFAAKYRFILIAFGLLAFIGFACVMTMPAQEIAKPTVTAPFFTKINMAVWSADLLIRGLDAKSTLANLNNPCNCYTENGTGFHNPAAQYSYSLGIVGAQIGVAYLAHRTHHRKIEKLITGYGFVDVGIEIKATAGNYAISGRKAAPVLTAPSGLRPILTVAK